MKIFTIGFTKKTAEEFFNLLKENGIQRLVDIRVHPGGQLAGFAKDRDLPYFLQELAGIEYVYLPELAPEAEMMKSYRKNKDWTAYERSYTALMNARNLPEGLDRCLFMDRVCCLLCSEHEATYCHRTVAAEMIQDSWEDVEVIHL